MPITRTSPPPRIPRSPVGSSTGWEHDSPMSPRRARIGKSPSPRSSIAPPMPPLPVMPSTPLLSPSPRRSSLKASGVSPFSSPSPTPPPPQLVDRNSSSSSGSSQRVSTPPPRLRSKSNSKLLPALPLSIDTTLAPTQTSRKSKVTLEDSSHGFVRIIISHDGQSNTTPIPRRSRRSSVNPSPGPSPSPSPGASPGASPSQKSRSPQSQPCLPTPPRPARRIITADPSDLVPPQASFRSSSPSGSSVSTITEGDTTPRGATHPYRGDSVAPSSASSLISVTSTPTSTSTPMHRKRDSSQRRLSALRGLVANLDFSQHWSVSQRTESAEGQVFWACGDPIVEESPEQEIQVPVPVPFAVPDFSSPGPSVSAPSLVRNVSQDHGWPSPPTPPKDYPLPSKSCPADAHVTPVNQGSLPRRPRSTPPRRPRLLARNSSELLSRTPDPPRASKQRMETYGVASSGYNKSLEAHISPSFNPHSTTTTWRSSLSNDEQFQRVLAKQGSLEIKRQEIMWEMCETEQGFVKSMKTVLRLFAIPLKTPQGKWIYGIPDRITELFDSLEQVAHVHGIFAASQRDMKRKNEILDTAAFIAMFRSWVDRLEVHESYLISFEPVVQLVEENVRDPESVFGEFVRMQMKDEVLGSMGLGSMLLKPVQRLTKYPLFIKRLLDVTPHPHPSHPELLSLLAKTESIILQLQATKAREEDFLKVKSLEARLHGLPEDFVLAVRGRKLIGQGQVARVLPGKDLSPSLGGRARAGSIHSSRGSVSSASSGAHSSSASSSPWDFSVFSPSSTRRTSAFSISSASSGCPPSRANSFNQSPSRPGVTRSPSSSSSVNSSDQPHHHRRPTTPSKLKRRDEALTMFIFDDFVVIAAPMHDKGSLFGSKKKGEKVNLKVLSEAEGGIGKVLDVKDWCGWQGHNSLFALTTVPLSYTARSPMVSPITTAYTLAPGSSTSSSSPRRGSITNTLNCPVLSTIPQFLSTLAQATTAATSMLFSSDYRIDEASQSGLESIGECNEWQVGAMGCAQ